MSNEYDATPPDTAKLCRDWVEIREENQGGKIVLRPNSADIPPARGRRGLDLSTSGNAAAQTAGPTDKIEGSAGAWSMDESCLVVEAPGWTGKYDIEELTEEKLVIKPID